MYSFRFVSRTCFSSPGKLWLYSGTTRIQGPSARRYGGRELAVLERFTGIIDRERIFRISNQFGLGYRRVLILAENEMAAGFASKRPWRAVPRITGIKTGRVASCVAMLGFVRVI